MRIVSYSGILCAGARLAVLHIVLGVVLAAGCSDRPPRARYRPAASPEPADNSAMTPEQMEEIEETVKAGLPALNRCYQAELEKSEKKFEARAVVKILIGTSRSATQVGLSETTIQAPSFASCVESTVRGWEFPTLKAAAWITRPVVFSPAW